MKKTKTKKKRKKKTTGTETVDASSFIEKQFEELGTHLVSRDAVRAKEGAFNVRTGILPLDLILTPEAGFRNGCVEIYGPEGIGKSSLAMAMISSAARVKDASKPMLIDVEHAVNDSLCDIFGIVPREDFFLAQPDNAEAALNTAELFLRSCPRALLIIDSIAMLMASSEWEEKAEDKSYAPVSIMLTKFAKKAPKLCKASDSLVVYLNQIRANLSGYGSPTRIPGPAAIKFNVSWRIEMKKGEKSALKQGEDQIGHKVTFRTIKNRFARPYQKATSNLIYGAGFHQGYDLIELAQAFGRKDLIARKGAWVTFYDDHTEQGLQKAADYIVDNPEVREHLEKEILEMYQ